MTNQAEESSYRRTPWDIILGVLVVVAGLILLSNVVFATAFTVLFIGWTALIAGVIELIGAFFKLRTGGFFWAALGGAVLIVVGLFLVRNLVLGAATLTLLAGSLFFANGLTRIVAAAQFKEGRWLLIISGAVSVLLGIWVLFNFKTATVSLLGTLLGIQTLVEGFVMLAVGRKRAPKETASSAAK